jgi:hypothetical protein
MSSLATQAAPATFAGQALQTFARNLDVMFDVVMSPRKVVRDVRAMQAMLREADACEGVDAARAETLRLKAERLVA